MSRIAIALSPTGHRSVTSVASVSGGSLTNGYVTQAVDHTSGTPQELTDGRAGGARETQGGAEP